MCSVATTADGFLDDTTPQRLVLSTPEDWAEVYRLRRQHDAILVGAETLRRDNPRLKCCPTKVSLTASGNLSSELRVFGSEGKKIIFSLRPLPQLAEVCEVVVLNEISAAAIVTELEKRGIQRLFVEGGSRVLNLFLEAELVDVLRVAVNPTIVAGEKGYAPFAFNADRAISVEKTNLGGMEVSTYRLKADTEADDRAMLRQAIEVSRQCVPSPSCYRVGAVIRTLDGAVFTGYTHETSPTHHAEQEALKKALAADADLQGATIYASMEPCSQRASEPLSCSALILKYGLGRVVFAAYEPSKFVCCEGALRLRQGGVDVRVYTDMADEVMQINSHLNLQ